MTTEKKTGLELMREKFADNQISRMCRSTKKDNPKGQCKKCGGYHGIPSIQLDYVGHAALTDRLLDCDPAWTWEPLSTGNDGYPVIDGNGGMWIKLTVCGVTRLGYGDAQGKTGGDAMKERIGDALRNAGMRFGAALELWHKGELHVDEDAPEPTPAKKPTALAGAPSSASTGYAEKPEPKQAQRPPVAPAANTISGDPSEGDLSGVVPPVDPNAPADKIIIGNLTHAFASKLNMTVPQIEEALANWLEAAQVKPMSDWTNKDVDEAREMFKKMSADAAKPTGVTL